MLSNCWGPSMEMTGWKNEKLHNLGFLGRGKSKHRPRNDSSLYGGDYPFIQTGDIKAANLYISDYSQTYNEKGLAQSKLWNKGTLCLTIAANIGETAILNMDSCFPDSIVGFIADPKKADTKFIKYYIDTIKKQMSNISQGATQENMSLEKIGLFDLLIPIPETQRKIAGILSAYDDLIENNNKRIKILEEMAQKLYKEWFVDFKFPNHENTKFINSELGKIPEGWEVVKLGSQLSDLESGKRPKGGITNDVVDGVPSIGAENINGIGKHNFDKEKLIPRDFFVKMKKGIIRSRDIAIYKDGAYIGRSSYFRDDFPHLECCVNEHVFLVRTKEERLTQNLLYTWLQYYDNIEAIRATNANAAQPGINQQSLKNLNIILPTQKITNNFEKFIEPIYANIISFSTQNKNLRKTRDLLLPRLISGELSVEGLENLEEAI